MKVSIHSSWKKILNEEFEKPYFSDLANFVKSAYKNRICFPKGKTIFACFNHCSFENLKVVIIGQDPYHGENQANGLCFSVQKGVIIPPSLQNIFLELQRDIGKPIPENGDLSHWAKQGVLLLNATLTVEKGKAGSHQNKGWETFTDSVIEKISLLKKDVVFLLWGAFAKSKKMKIDTSKHKILTSGHPSPLSANKGYWFGNQHFSKTNLFLKAKGYDPINW